MDTKAAEFAQKLGARIVQLRKEHNFAQERLATLAKMNKGYLSSVESGQRVPSVGMLMKLSKVLQVGVFELFVFPEGGAKERLWEEIRLGGDPVIEQVRGSFGLGPSPAQLAGALASGKAAVARTAKSGPKLLTGRAPAKKRTPTKAPAKPARKPQKSRPVRKSAAPKPKRKGR